VAAALTLLVLGGVGAVQAGMTGASFMFDLEQVEPALIRHAPAIQDPETPRLARRVFLVVIDGLRLDRSYELPFLDELRPPHASGVRTNHHATPVLLDSLMDRARAAGLRVATATDYDVLPRLFLRRQGHGPPPAELDSEAAGPRRATSATRLRAISVAAGLFWAFFPPPYVDLPGPVTLVLIPAALVAVACAAVNVALTLALEVIVFAARAWMRVPPPLE
jgi:hypothetical protein